MVAADLQGAGHPPEPLPPGHDGKPRAVHKMTRKQIAEALDGLDPSTVEAVLRATGPVRHAHRVRAAINAAYEAAPYSNPEEIALLWLEAQMAREGKVLPGYTPPTQRLSPFRGLGRGRRHADDGAIWTVAIDQAWRISAGWEPDDVRLVGRLGDGTNAVAVAITGGPLGRILVPVEDLPLDRDDRVQVARFAAREAVRRGDSDLLRAAGLLMWSLMRPQDRPAVEPATESAAAAD